MSTCPRCTSPQPHLHPAVQAGGEVQPCSHVFHDAATPSQPQGRVLVSSRQGVRAEDFTPDIYWGQPIARRVRRRPRTRIVRGIRRLLGQWWISTSAFGLILGGALYFLSAPPAHADSTDTVFLAVLAADGFTYDHAMVAKVISNGHQVCAMLVAGVKPFDIVARLDATEPGLGRPESAQFAALANAVYCPQFGSAVTVA